MTTSTADAVRMQKARMAVAGERDKLLKRADRRLDLTKYLHNDGKERARAIVVTACFSLFGMMPYASILWIWFAMYHETFAQSAVLAVLLFVVGFLFLAGSTKRAMGKDRPWMWWFGLVWLQAAAAGFVFGFFLYFRSMAFYWRHEQMRTYTNVAGAQAADAFGDGSMFLFTQDTNLDASRAVGYKSKWTGETYCVAPIVDPSMNQASAINYWAVGLNCCTPRGEFHCGDSHDFTTRSGLRKLEPDEVARPWMQWAMQGNTYSKYMEAVRLQTASFFTTSARMPTLLLWSKDPIALKESYYTDARDMCIHASLVYFAIVAIGCYQIAWKLIPRQKPEGVLREA